MINEAAITLLNSLCNRVPVLIYRSKEDQCPVLCQVVSIERISGREICINGSDYYMLDEIRVELS